MSLDLIAAMAANGVIGDKGTIPWYEPEDLKYFKRRTLGRICIVARKTAQLLPPLKGRTVLTVSRMGYAGAHRSLDDAIMAAEAIDPTLPPIIIGGAQLYSSALPAVTRMFLTFVDKTVQGDTVFPTVDWNDWQLVWEARVPGLHFTEYSRIR